MENANETIDKIFLLSVWEAYNYFPTVSMRYSDASDYVKQISSENDNGWLLRTAQPFDSRVLIMRFGEPVSNYVYDQKPHILSDRIRPAFWFDLQGIDAGIANIQVGQTIPVGNDMSTADYETDERVGKIVVFGSYEQDDNLENGSEPIEWIILDIQNGDVLLLSRYALDCQKFHHFDYKATWEESDIRTWLNSDFYTTAFSEQDQNQILESTLANSKGTGDVFEDQPPTMDKVFLLSRDEVLQFIPNEENRICTATPFAMHTTGTVEYVSWALRTPYDNKNFNHGSIHNVVESGGIYCNNFTVSNLFTRPAIRIDISALKE